MHENAADTVRTARNTVDTLSAELVFDRGPTTHANLARFNAMGAAFLTLRQR